jgi:hypothetical protein
LDATTGEYKDYFVWAGGLAKDIPDATEPGMVVVTNFYFNLYKCL